MSDKLLVSRGKTGRIILLIGCLVRHFNFFDNQRVVHYVKPGSEPAFQIIHFKPTFCPFCFSCSVHHFKLN